MLLRWVHVKVRACKGDSLFDKGVVRKNVDILLAGVHGNQEEYLIRINDQGFLPQRFKGLHMYMNRTGVLET